jgi:hypothetical protein
MKVINPVLRKVLVELNGLDTPLEFWWDDKMLRTFESMMKSDKESVIRAPNTPNSIIEFELQNFNDLRVTETTNVVLKGNCLQLTNVFRFYSASNLPLPKHTFNDEFEFPITLICLSKKNLDTPTLIDYSNYINLDYLKNKGLTIGEMILERTKAANRSTNSPQILFAEYTSLAYY